MFSACQSTPKGTEKTLYVGPQLVDCQGVGPMKCMQVREDPSEEWRLFYDAIDGFTYEEGFIYTLRVLETKVENPPADGSALRWQLLELVAKEEAPPPKDEGKTWKLAAFGQPDDLTLVPVDISATLTMDLLEKKFFGNGGCNRYSGVIFSGEGGLRFGEIMSTKMACPGEAMAIENNFLTMLPTVNTYRVEEGQLILDCDDGRQLIFASGGN